MMQVNESLLRSIVTQPWDENYVYARSFATLELVRNLVLNKACRVVVTAQPSSTPSQPLLSATTTLATIQDRGETLPPFYNGTVERLLFLLGFRIFFMPICNKKL